MSSNVRQFSEILTQANLQNMTLKSPGRRKSKPKNSTFGRRQAPRVIDEQHGRQSLRAEDEKGRDLAERYSYFVKLVVKKMVKAMSLPLDNQDEYLSAGYLGLVEAAARFKGGSGVDFRSFAYLRIRGAVIDNIRLNSQLSGRAYRCAKALQAMNSARQTDLESAILKPRKRRKPEEELADVLDFAARGALAHRLAMHEAEDELVQKKPDHANPEKRLENIQEGARIRSFVATLPKKERLIVEEFYFSDKSFTEIANEHRGLSKSWVSRLHTRALENLKSRLLDSERLDSDGQPAEAAPPSKQSVDSKKGKAAKKAKKTKVPGKHISEDGSE